MGIDIKTLHIGSHVLWNGKRRKVDAITDDSIAFSIADTERKEYDSSTIEGVEPILITPALLEELGFEEMFWPYERAFVKELHGKGFARIQYEDNEWRVSYYPNKDCCYGEIRDAKYLHIAEAFLALYGVELIPG